MTVSLLAFALAVSIAPVRDSRARLATYTPSVRKPPGRFRGSSLPHFSRFRPRGSSEVFRQGVRLSSSPGP